MLRELGTVINVRIWELMSSTLEEKTHRTADRGRDIRTARGWIARRLDGILEDQKHYVKRVGRETNG